MIGRIAVGHHREARKPDCIRAVCGELILTFLFVFTSVGSSMTAGKLEGGDGTVMGLTATALANSLVVAAMVSSGVHISGSHFNPAVTLGIAMGGYITLFRSLLYMMAQLLGSTLACLLLKFLAGSQEIPISRVAEEMTALQGVGMEITLTFLLLFSVYAIIIDPKKTVPDGLGSLFIGLLICTISLVGGSFSGASMNPARSFGPAFASGNWTHQWVYWVGPIIGSGLAGLIYENLFMVDKHVFITKKEEFY